ncbi:acyltransferase [Agrobacterium sp.]|uniref:acyltransferase family protein n=1 Tax=Agrobacterium sp. TaxID=361 RepID=UPI00289BE3D1|nr:acyltransferase [Agrobacterium sp.]
MRENLNNLKPLRLICALSVVFAHSFSVVSGNYLDEPFQKSTGYSIGDYAVIVFFAISGIVIPLSLERNPDMLRFWARRMLRIFPALIVCVAAVAFALGPAVSTLSVDAYFADPRFVKYLFGASSLLATSQGLPGVYETLPDAEQVNVPLWTLKYEILAYFFAAIIFGTIRADPMKRLIFMALLLVVFLSNFIWLEVSSKLFNAQVFLTSFFCAAIFYGLIKKCRTATLGAILSGLFVILLIGTPAWLPAISIVLALATLAIAYAPPIPVLTNDRFGDYSYGLYVFAYPIQQLIVLMYPQIGVLFHFTASLLICVPLAYCSLHILESRAASLVR